MRSKSASTSTPKFTDSYPLVTPAAVRKVERRLKVKFPADYRQFLLTTNGGTPTPKHFTVPERGDAIADWWYSIRQERTPGDLEYEQEQAAFWDPLPPGFLAIAHDPGGNTLLLSTQGDDAGSIYFWDRNGLWVREDGKNTFPVASDFTSFLASLWTPPPEKLAKKKPVGKKKALPKKTAKKAKTTTRKTKKRAKGS